MPGHRVWRSPRDWYGCIVSTTIFVSGDAPSSRRGLGERDDLLLALEQQPQTRADDRVVVREIPT